MVSLGFLLVYTFGDCLVPILVVMHTLEDLDRGDKPEETRIMKVNHKI